MKTTDHNSQTDFDTLVSAWTSESKGSELSNFLHSNVYELERRWQAITLRPLFWRTIEAKLSKDRLNNHLELWFSNISIDDIAPSAMGDELMTMLLQGWVFDWIRVSRYPSRFVSKVRNYIKKMGKEEADRRYGHIEKYDWNIIVPPREKIATTTNKEDDLEELVRLWVKNPRSGVAEVVVKNLETWNLVTSNPLFWKRVREEMSEDDLLATMSTWFGCVGTNISFPAMGRDLAISLLAETDWILSYTRNHMYDSDNFARKVRNFLRKLGKEKVFSDIFRSRNWGALERLWEELFPEDNIKTSSTLSQDDLDTLDLLLTITDMTGDLKDKIGDTLRIPGSLEYLLTQDKKSHIFIRLLHFNVEFDLYIPINQLKTEDIIPFLSVARPFASPRPHLRSRTLFALKRRLEKEGWNKQSIPGEYYRIILDQIFKNSAKTSKYIQIPAPVLNQVSYIIKEKLKEVYKTDNQKETLSQIRFRPYSFSLDEEEVQNMPNPKGDLSIETLIIRFLLDSEATPEHPLLVGGEYRTTSEKGQPVEAEIDLYVNGSLTYEELIHHISSLEDFEYSQHIIEHELIHLYDKTTREKREEKERTDREYYNQPQEVRAYRANLIKEFELWVYDHQPKELDSKLLDSFLRESKFWKLNKWLYPENRRAFLKELGRRLHEYSTRTKEMAYGVPD